MFFLNRSAGYTEYAPVNAVTGTDALPHAKPVESGQSERNDGGNVGKEQKEKRQLFPNFRVRLCFGL